MIKKGTVFILGSGASIPYKYPSGVELVNKICSTLGSVACNTFNELRECGFGATAINDFRDALYGSGAESVDGFLEYRPEFMPIGKIAMAQALIPYENEAELFRRESDNWYIYLFEKFDMPFAEFCKNNHKIGFITFNYDRSLEHFLFTAMRKKYGVSEADCAKALKSIPIIHVYGMLDRLPWQEEGGGGRPHDSEYNLSMLKESAEKINIISGDTGDNSAFKKAGQLLQDAERIYFLGFGYNSMNLKRLDILSACKKNLRAAYGTVYNISAAERKPIATYLKDLKITLGDETTKTLPFLKEHLEFQQI